VGNDEDAVVQAPRLEPVLMAPLKMLLIVGEQYPATEDRVLQLLGVIEAALTFQEGMRYREAASTKRHDEVTVYTLVQVDAREASSGHQASGSSLSEIYWSISARFCS
jgi:endonuclease/exonuclease/phosphatase (EEP) superfamily protein YafD